MNALLFDERPIVANPILAREIGLNEAIVLQQINFWLEINKQNGKNYHDGKYWTYNSIRAWHESDFSYLSYETVKRTFSKLEKAGYLFTGNYNKDPRDKTKWYSLNYDKIFTLEEEVKQKRNNVASKALNKADENDVTIALGQIDPMEKFKLIQCNNSERTNGFVQTEPMQSVNMSQPLPNNTSNNTTDKNYKITRALKDTEKRIDDNTKLIDQAEKYLKHKDTYKAYTKLKKSKQEDFYNEHTAEIILFESAKKYLKEHLGESKSLNISKWKSEVTAFKKEKDSLYSQIIDMRKEVEQAESVRSCIEKLQQENREITQAKKQELDL